MSRFVLQVEGGETYPLPPGTTAVGRASDNDIVLSDQSVSRHHAIITASDRRLRVKDLDSRSGVLLNGQTVAESEFADGDTLRFGNVKMTVLDDTKVHTE